jgi:excisionase family DNA binding protein
LWDAVVDPSTAYRAKQPEFAHPVSVSLKNRPACDSTLPMSGDALTSAEAAELLGVSASTVKRWVDTGELESTRTVGGHRRIRRTIVERFRARMDGVDPGPAGPSPGLVDLLLSDTPAQEVEARMMTLRSQAGSAAALGDVLAPAIQELGERWTSGGISMVEERLASERLSRALARLVEWVPIDAAAPRALLATAYGDDHTLGLSVVELVLREAGWHTLWAGRHTPPAEIAAAVIDRSHGIRLVALSASIASRDRRALAAQEKLIGEACREAGAQLIVGGSGAWPESPRHGTLLRDFRQLDRLARDLAARPR